MDALTRMSAEVKQGWRRCSVELPEQDQAA
jgi:hypothetical protein